MNPFLLKLDRVNLKSAFLSTPLSPSLDGEIVGDLITNTHRHYLHLMIF